MSLRDALEKLIDERRDYLTRFDVQRVLDEDRWGATESDPDGSEVWAAAERAEGGQITEPTPDRQPSDAAVEAAFDAYCSEGLGEAAFRESIHAALVAAYRVDAPRLNRGALSRRIEEIVDRSAETGVLSHNELVDAVFELLNGTKS